MSPPSKIGRMLLQSVILSVGAILVTGSYVGTLSHTLTALDVLEAGLQAN